jgi:DNA-binding HxlR family transcriptional regulator
MGREYNGVRDLSSVRSRKKGTETAIGAFCPRFHRAVELVGGRWTGAIIRMLLGGSLRFSELASAVPGMSDRLLAQRLKELESEGIVRRTVDDGPPVRVAYSLTAAGEELESTIRSLGTWAERWIPMGAKH